MNKKRKEKNSEKLFFGSINNFTSFVITVFFSKGSRKKGRTIFAMLQKEEGEKITTAESSKPIRQIDNQSREQRLINLEILVLVCSLKSSNIELG